jgi:hypothetical protein
MVTVGGALAVPTKPAELAYALTRDEFDLLCETETINEDKRWRDISIAFFAAAAAGLLGLLGGVDWDQAFATKHWNPLIYTLVLGVLAATSLVISIIQGIKARRKPISSGYSRVKVRIRTHYEQHPR